MFLQTNIYVTPGPTQGLKPEIPAQGRDDRCFLMRQFVVISALCLVACSAEQKIPVLTDDTDLQAVTATSLYNIDEFSKELAAHLGLEIGMERDWAEAEIRGYFGTTASTGQIPVFQSKTLADGGFEIVATRNGLADDSVRSEQVIAIFSDNILIDYGKRVACYRAPNPKAWTKELCP